MIPLVSFDIAFMNEFSMEENIELARKFVEEQLVARGMIADLAIHDPKKAKDKIPNPHMHIMVPIRPLQEDGTWGQKQKKVPVLTPDGQPVLNQPANKKSRLNLKNIENFIQVENWVSK